MRHGIIPDIHDKVDLAQRIMDKVPNIDRWVLLGDYFDDFTTGEDDARKTAKKVREWMDDPRIVVLIGNHDLAYRWGSEAPWHLCSGYSPYKYFVIHKELGEDYWKRFLLHVWIPGERPWLLTHAGFDKHFLPKGGNIFEDFDPQSALDSLHDPDVRGRGCELLGAGGDRGGWQRKGGVVWCDWRSLEPPAGANQLVGHTRNAQYRNITGLDFEATCLDTGLQHYAVIEDGRLEVFGVEGIA